MGPESLVGVKRAALEEELRAAREGLRQDDPRLLAQARVPPWRSIHDLIRSAPCRCDSRAGNCSRRDGRFGRSLGGLFNHIRLDFLIVLKFVGRLLRRAVF